MPAAQIGMDNGLLTKKKTNGAFTWAANSSLKQNEFSFYSAGKMMRYIRSEAGTNGDRFRLITVMALFCAVFGVIAARLVILGFASGVAPSDEARVAIIASRPDLVDRNGELLATDISTVSLFAEPRRIVDADEASERLRTILPELDANTLHAKLSGDAGFVWLKRKLTLANSN